MKLIDNSGGIWGEIILKRKSADIVLRQRLTPGIQLMKVLGEEGISAIKGSVKHKVIFQTLGEGRIAFHRFPSGTYQTGILKHRSPDGSPYEELSPVTLRIRKFKGVVRGLMFILRETSKHIFYGLHIKRATQKSVDIGWEGEDEIRSQQHEAGFSAPNPRGVGQPNIQVPARKHRGFSQEFIDNFHSIIKAFMR